MSGIKVDGRVVNATFSFVGRSTSGSSDTVEKGSTPMSVRLMHNYFPGLRNGHGNGHQHSGNGHKHGHKHGHGHDHDHKHGHGHGHGHGRGQEGEEWLPSDCD
jgi:hypothetical protein